MRIPVGKISLAIVASIGAAVAQENPGAPSAAGQPAAPAGSPVQVVAPQAPVSGNESSTGLDYLYNQKPQQGSVGAQAMGAGAAAQQKEVAADAVGANRQGSEEQQARYKTYLSTAEVPQATINDYLAKMKEVSDLLRDEKLMVAWKELYDLADYESIDAGVSKALAARVEAVWTTGKASDHIDQQNGNLQHEVQKANWNADEMSQSIQDQEIEYQKRLADDHIKQQQPQSRPSGGVPQGSQQGGDSSLQTPPTPAMGSEGRMELTEEYLRSLELKAKIKVNELKQQNLLNQAQKDFASYVKTLFDTGRLNHVVIAADFYRKVFEEGDYPADMAQQVNEALEINRDVASAIEVVRYKIGRGEISSANDTLQWAFLKSELNPAVLGLDRSLKAKVDDFNQKLDQMQNLIEARDFGNLEPLLKQVKAEAVDYDTTKPMAMVNAVKLQSKMHLGKAKLAAQQGDLKTAMDEFQAASEAWPGNPDLDSNAGTFFNTQDAKTQALTEFDRLVDEKNYRAIFDKQLAFAPAIKGDTKREEELKTALEAIQGAEVATEKANTLMLNGDYAGAWETIELACANLPDDEKLNKLRADLSGRSAEFVSAVDKARDAESQKELGYSLTWYVNAQREYPASRIANDGIDRLSKKLLSGAGM